MFNHKEGPGAQQHFSSSGNTNSQEPWNRLHRTPPSFPTLPPWLKPGDVERGTCIGSQGRDRDSDKRDILGGNEDRDRDSLEKRHPSHPPPIPVHPLNLLGHSRPPEHHRNHLPPASGDLQREKENKAKEREREPSDSWKDSGAEDHKLKDSQQSDKDTPIVHNGRATEDKVPNRGTTSPYVRQNSLERSNEGLNREALEKKTELMYEQQKKNCEVTVKEERKEEQEGAQLTTYRALYSFVARNADELSIDAHGLIEVDEHTVGEPGWLFGSYHGNRGWFPQSYAEKCPTPSPLASSASSRGKASGPPPTLKARDSGVEEEGDSTASVLSDAPQPSGSLLARAVSSWSATSETLLSPSSDASSALLSFSQGDVISVLQQRDDWWFGQLNGMQGWFPQTCVTLEAAGNPDLDSLDSCDPAQLEEYVALYTYESPETGDLTFAEGDVVMVTEREGEWWRGCIGDQTGVFPSNYVRPVEPEGSRPGVSNKRPAEIAQAITSTLAPAAHRLCLSPGQLVVVRAKNSTGWWLGELQVRGRKRQKGWLHSSHVRLLGPSSSKSSPSPLPVCQVIAMYDYAAANQDELSFSKGQLINVLDKTNPDWWKGEANGVTGLLPTNYVTMTTESDPSQQ
uniref:Intersectin 2a n=1 Tax=Nothobranchius kadleci TaxID=1051664 RepID=A0A1A8EG61_NOTKA